MKRTRFYLFFEANMIIHSPVIYVEYKIFGSTASGYIKYSLLCDFDLILFTLKYKGKKKKKFEDGKPTIFSFNLTGQW